MGSIEAKKHRAVNVMRRESVEEPKGITPARAYDIAIKHLDDHKLAVDLLTSDVCGYDKNQITVAIYQKNYQKNYYQSHKEASNQVRAF